MTGNLPANLTIIATKPSSFTSDREDEDGEAVTLKVRAAFVSDAANPKTIEKGRGWARGYRHGGVSREFTVENSPAFMATARVVGLEVRSEGGRAWKVVTEWEGESYLFDLRESTLLDAMTGLGIGPGGKILTPLVWGKVGSQMKLIPVDSAIYKALLEANEVDKLAPVKPADLKVGDVLEAKNGDRAVFLGWVSTIDMEVEEDRYRGTETITLKRLPKMQAWYRIPHWDDSSKTQKAVNEMEWWCVDIKKTCSYRKRAGSAKVPVDWTERVEKDIRKGWAEEKTKPYNTSHFRASNMACWCARMHVTPLGAPVAALKDEWKAWASFLKD